MDYSKFYTPPEIAKALINELAIPTPPKVADICCGSCNLLFAAKNRWPKIKLYGVDISSYPVKGVTFEKEDGRQFAINHPQKFPFVVANPPFHYVENKKQFPDLFMNQFKGFSTSRLEIEMLIANLNLLKPNGVLLIILPSSFVEAETYNKVRRIVSANYYVESIIKLDESTFGSSKINSYALIIHNEPQGERNAKTGIFEGDSNNCVSYNANINSEDLKNGNWTTDKRNCPSFSLNVKRGNISSANFIAKGQSVLHTAKCNIDWKPSTRYISKKTIPTVFAETGDIVVSRIGKSAGKWCVYSGEKIPISDCLYRIKDPDGSIYKMIKGKAFNLSLKGVATRYITISDFLSWINLTAQEG